MNILHLQPYRQETENTSWLWERFTALNHHVIWTCQRSDLRSSYWDALTSDSCSSACLPTQKREIYVLKIKMALLSLISHNLWASEQKSSLFISLIVCIQDQPSEGFFTEGAFVLVEGDYTEDQTFIVIAIGHPPCESRQTARWAKISWFWLTSLTFIRSIYGHVDFLGKGATTPLEDVSFRVRHLSSYLWCVALQSQYALHIQEDLSDVTFFVLSDVWLDHPDTLRGLQKLFDNCIETNFIPKVMIMCGNFTSRGISQGSNRDISKYQGTWYLISASMDWVNLWWSYRGVWFISRFDCFLSSNDAKYTFLTGARTIGFSDQFHLTSTTSALVFRLPLEVKGTEVTTGQ